MNHARLCPLEPRRLLAAGDQFYWDAAVDYGGYTAHHAVDVQRDGKIVVASEGYDAALDASRVTVSRFKNGSGGLDAAFNDVANPTPANGDGTISFTFATPPYDEVADVKVDAAGRIYVLGTAAASPTGPRTLALARLTPAGKLDPTFGGGGGRVLVPLGNLNVTPTTLALAPGGDLVIGGSESGGDAFLARTNAAGALQASFSGDGWRTVEWNAPDAQFDVIQDLYVDTSGVVTFAGTDFTTHANVGRVGADGALVASFGANGVRRVDVADGVLVDTVALAAQAGKIVLAYSASITFESDLVGLARLTANGAVDSSFGANGVVQAYTISSDGVGDDYYGADVEKLIAQRDGKLLVLTTEDDGSALARYNADGSVDATWADGSRAGVVPQPQPDPNPDFYAVDAALDGDGRVYVVGTGADGGLNTVYRFDPGQYASTFGGGWALGATVQAEDFDVGVNGDAYTDVTPVYDTLYRGGFFDLLQVDDGRRVTVGELGEWVEHTFAVPAGLYALTVVASGGSVSVATASGDSVLAAGTLNFAGQSYQTQTLAVPLGSSRTVRLTTTSGIVRLDTLRLTASPNTASLSGTLWRDDDADDVRDAAEPAVVNRVVYLDLDNDGALDAPEPTRVTDVAGNYLFQNLAAGTYKIRQVLPGGWQQTFPNNGYGQNATLAAGGSAANLNFGSRPIPAPTGTSSVGGLLWRDANGDDAKTPNEPVLPNRTVWLDFDNDRVLDAGEPTRVTGSNGRYAFTNLAAGTYKVRQVLPAGWEQTSPNNGFGQLGVVAAGQFAKALDFGSRPITTTAVMALRAAPAGTRTALFGELGIDEA